MSSTTNDRRSAIARSAAYAFVWLALATVAYLGFEGFVSPRIARPAITQTGEPVIVQRSHDQHFYVEGFINGHPVTFLIDTGATLVSVNQTLAREIGLPSGVPAVFETAAGRSAGRIVPSASVSVGGIRVDDIRIGVGDGDRALLGQNFLNKVQMSQDGDRLVLRAMGS